MMEIEKELLGLSEVAEIFGVKKSAISNIRKRDETFPDPYEEVLSGPIWKTIDIYNYGIKTGRIKKNIILLPTMQGKSKKIAVIGRARTGKSFIVAMFDEDPYMFRRVFCSNGDDKTACAINNIFMDIERGFVEFISDFHVIHKSDVDNDLYTDILADVEFYNSIQVPFDDEDKVSIFIDKVENIVKEINSIEASNPNMKKSNTYLNVYSRPSKFCKKLMSEAGLKRLELIDTPGVSGKVEFARISKADLYAFVLKPENGDEAQTLKRIVNEIKPYVATSQVCFLYKMEAVISSHAKYERKREEVRNNMKAFEDLFSELRGSIISTGMDLLSPSKSCIMFPTMDDEEVTFTEEMFQEEFGLKILSSFSTNSRERTSFELSKLVEEHGEKVNQFVLDIMRNIPSHDLRANGSNYTTENFVSEKHDRVKTNDRWRIVNDLYYAYRTEKNHLYQYFDSFTPTEYSEEWEQKAIKYVFHLLTESINKDKGVGIGSYWTEESPALTMITSESILAREVYTALIDSENNSLRNNYIDALQNGGITSKTWKYVFCNDDENMVTKLELIVKSLEQNEVSNRKSMILSRYIGGLRKLAEYKILLSLGMSKEKSMQTAIELPF
jgi:hypothetical protein